MDSRILEKLKKIQLPFYLEFEDKIINSAALFDEPPSSVVPELSNYIGKSGNLLLGDKLLAKVILKEKEDNGRKKVYVFFKKSGPLSDEKKLAQFLSGISLHLTCYIGSTRLSIEQVSALSPGKVIPLQSAAVEIRAEEYEGVIGSGDIITEAENFCVKIKEIKLPGSAPQAVEEEGKLFLRAELGKAKISLEKLLQLNPGDHLLLDRSLSEPVEALFSNGLRLPVRTTIFRGRPALKFISPGIHPPLSEPSGEAVPESQPPGNGDLSITLKYADPALTALSIKEELPQTIAYILYQMDEFKAAKVLKFLPPALQVDVTAKIVSLDRKFISPTFVSILSRHLSHIANTDHAAKKVEHRGISFAAKMLKYADKMTEETIIHGLEREHPDLAESIKYSMFIFEDIKLMDDRAVQRILKEVDTRDLAIALKSASRELVVKVEHNISSRAAEQLRSEMDYLGPVLRSDVEKAQLKIIDFIRSLEENGEVVIEKTGYEVI